MRTKFTLCALLAAGLTASAVPQLSIVSYSDTDETPLKSRSEYKATDFSIKSLQQGVINQAPQRVAELGTELTPILFEDFSLFATGSIEDPDYTVDLIADEYEYIWANMKDDYTLTPGWGSNFVYPAGGYAYMDANSSTMEARLTTPLVNVSENGGVATLRFKARTLDGMTSDYLLIEAAETNNWGPSWDIKTSGYCPTIIDEWQTFEVTIQNGGPTTLFNIVATGGIEIIIDDIEIFQYDLYVGIPEPNNHTNYTGTSFDLSWNEVEGAESYLINLYTQTQDMYTGQISRTFLYENEPVAENKWTATGIVSGETYYYTVRAVKGEHISLESLPVEIYDLEAPIFEGTPAIDDNGQYSVAWNTVPSAEVYNYWVYADRKATNDGEFVLTNQPFENLKESDGGDVSRSIEKPDYMVYDEYFVQTGQGGWRVRNGAPCTEYVVVDAWHYINGNGDAGILSPEMDLSKDGGKINLSLSLWGELTQGYDWDDNPCEFQTQCAVALFVFNEEKGDYDQAELIYIEDVEPAWNDFTIELTKGGERSIIGIYAVRAEGNLYIDNVKISQNYKSGESFFDPVIAKMWYNGTSADIQLPDIASDCEIWHKVCAVKIRVGNDGINQTLNAKESAYSQTQYIGQSTFSSIQNFYNFESSARVANGELKIVNPGCEAVYVYDVAGKLIYANASGEENINIILPENGIYLIKVGNKITKVIR